MMKIEDSWTSQAAKPSGRLKIEKKVEDYLNAQLVGDASERREDATLGEGINALHYKDLLLRVKKITERYASAK